MASFNLFTKVVCVNKYLQYMSCMCFVKMDKLEYCVIIKFFVLDGLTSTELHPKLTKVYRNSAHQFQSLKSGQMNINTVAYRSKMTHVKDGQELQSHWTIEKMHIILLDDR